jgi:hypothetical protein
MEVYIEPWAGAHITDVIKEALNLSFINEGCPVVFTFNGKRYQVKGRGVVDAIIEAGKEVS